MTVQPTPGTAARAAGNAGELVWDGLFTGMIGATLVALWFLALDVAQGRPFFTPALLGTVMLHGAQVAANGPVIAPLEIAVYTAFHFVVFVAVGFGFAWLMNLFERFPIVFFVLLVLALCLQLGFFALNLVLGAELLGLLPVWSVVVANLLAAGGMAFYQWKRHPSVMKGVEKLWQHEGGA
jgi:hypothetical protein